MIYCPIEVYMERLFPLELSFKMVPQQYCDNNKIATNILNVSISFHEEIKTDSTR